MISLELAEKLQSAGLVWEPKNGDIVLDLTLNEIGAITGIESICNYKTFTIRGLVGGSHYTSTKTGKCLWYPRLDQLLTEIEALGCEWETGLTMTHGGPMMPGKRKWGYWCEVWLTRDTKIKHKTDCNSPECTVALALLWVLEGKHGQI